MTPPDPGVDVNVAIADLRKDIDHIQWRIGKQEEAVETTMGWLDRLLNERRVAVEKEFQSFKRDLDAHLDRLNDAAATFKELRGTFLDVKIYSTHKDEILRRLGDVEAHRQNFLGRETVIGAVIAFLVSLLTVLLAVWLRMR